MLSVHNYFCMHHTQEVIETCVPALGIERTPKAVPTHSPMDTGFLLKAF